MIKKITEVKESLKEKVIDSLTAEYKEIIETWKTLEIKAQGTIAIAGIFIAGAFAYLRDITEQTLLYERIVLTIVIICLVISVILSILALKIREISYPPIGEYVDNLLNDLLKIKDDKEFLERIPLFLDDQIATWKNINKEAVNTNELKARHLWKAQLFLITSVISIAMLVIIKIYK